MLTQFLKDQSISRTGDIVHLSMIQNEVKTWWNLKGIKLNYNYTLWKYILYRWI